MNQSAKTKTKTEHVELLRVVAKRAPKHAKALEAAAAGIAKVKKPLADKWPWPTAATAARTAAAASIEAFTSKSVEPVISATDTHVASTKAVPQVIYMVAIGTMYDPENDGCHTERIGVNLMFANYPDSAAISGACAADPTFSRHPGFKSAMRNILHGLRIWGIPQIPDADKQRSGYVIHAVTTNWMANVSMHESSELSHCTGTITIFRKTLN